ncbi:MAG: FAD-dependent oxidoreductase [Deltaproteobacteria bacterium]|nr:FAD-dependent oxidoreductase [Deltaproteobacteria bacterium]
MPTETVDTLIIGGGLSGIYAAYLLSQKNKPFVLLEARDRAGGRILSPEHRGFFSDLGPSWYWPAINPKMTQLIQSLGLKGYRQFEEGMGRFQSPSGAVRTVSGYAMEPLSWRLSGGMMALITKLREDIPENAVRLNHPVCKIEKKVAGVLVSVGELEKEPWIRFTASKVILALPPRLAAATILFDPDLSHNLTQAMLKIGTWMAGQAKFCALYEEPFWRQAGLSGQAFSQSGPMGEIHDGSNNSRAPYGLTGFVGIPAVQRNHQQLLTEAILSQLEIIYGKPAAQPTTLFYQDWARERFTATQFDQPPMYEHPLYQPPAGRTSIWDGTIHFAGTETANQHGGYLEGALTAAERAVMNP